MPSISFKGQKKYVPGVYTDTEVVSSSPGPLPAFHIPVLLGHGVQGHPYNAATKLVLGESDPSPFKLCQTDSFAGRYFGAGCELHRGMRFAKRHGLPFAYVVNLSDMVRASIIADTVTTNVEQFTLYARTWGPVGGWIKLTHATGVITIVPVKRYALLSANLGSSAVRAYFAAKHDWMTIGATITIGANDVAGVSRTIVDTGTEMLASGQLAYWVKLSSAVGSACNTSQYAMVLQYDTDRTVITPTFTTSQEMIDYFNDDTISEFFRAVKHTNFTDALPENFSAAPLKEITAWNTVTKGTAPAVTGSDIDAFIAAMNAGEWDKFAVREQLVPQTYCLLSSDATNHGKMRDYATAERTRGFPISVTVGCAWGDTAIAAGDATDPTFRAAALNSENVLLAAGGLDYEGAYLSLSPAIWGRRVEGGPGHNLTNDDLVFSKLETSWDEIDSGELSSLCKKGVATYKLSIAAAGFRYRVSQGLSTLQANNGAIWNESDATTWSVEQRDLADFVERTLKLDFEENAIGADEVDANSIAAMLVRRAEKDLVGTYVESFTVDEIVLNSGANGYDVTWSVVLKKTTDFITVTTRILVGEA